MIQVTRLDGSAFYLNADFIQSVESKPDTHVVLVNGHSFVVREPDIEVVDRVIAYRRTVQAQPRGAEPYLRLLDQQAHG